MSLRLGCIFVAVLGFAVFSSKVEVRAQSFTTSIPPAINDGAQWRIVKTKWDASDEAGYSAFVKAIGQSVCSSLADCLEDPANPYRDSDKRSFWGDCADMVYTLRAYYAWKNGLPFSHQSLMQPNDKASKDARFSRDGNRIATRRDAVGRTPVNGPNFIAGLRNIVSTAMFRTHPDIEGKLHDDFYSVHLTREALKPGAIAYDIYGHVGLVYDITDDGRILIVASHPDNSVTRTVYGYNFLRAKPELGAGLKAWRPVVLEGATQKNDGTFAGGRIKRIANAALRDFSLV